MRDWMCRGTEEYALLIERKKCNYNRVSKPTHVLERWVECLRYRTRYDTCLWYNDSWFLCCPILSQMKWGSGVCYAARLWFLGCTKLAAFFFFLTHWFGVGGPAPLHGLSPHTELHIGTLGGACLPTRRRRRIDKEHCMSVIFVANLLSPLESLLSKVGMMMLGSNIDFGNSIMQ